MKKGVIRFMERTKEKYQEAYKNAMEGYCQRWIDGYLNHIWEQASDDCLEYLNDEGYNFDCGQWENYSEKEIESLTDEWETEINLNEHLEVSFWSEVSEWFECYKNSEKYEPLNKFYEERKK